MPSLKKTKEDTMAVINSAITILNRMPALEQTNATYSYNESSNPFEFIIDIFKSTAGYDVLINIISKYIALGLPALEVAVKAILLSNIKNILNCAINPFITKELLTDGIVFDLKQIDLMNILYYCPLDATHIGQRYYFGCDGFHYAHELEKAGDFNAFLWFEKNMGINRSVWYGVDRMSALVDDSSYTNGISYVWQKTPASPPDPVPQGQPVRDKDKCKSGCGILTLDYHERPISLKDAVGGERFLQTPYSNCLQVFIGNVRPHINEEIGDELRDKQAKMGENEKDIEKVQKKIDNLDKEIDENNKKFKDGKIKKSEHNTNNRNLNERKRKTINELDRLKEQRNSYSSAIKTLTQQYYAAVSNAEIKDYRRIEQNYYYRRTLLQFNTDYVMSLKLFDSKVVTAQLLDALTGCLSFDLNLSFEQLIIKNEVEKMVKMVIETDDAVISDCFFTFSNEEYENLVRKAEMMRAGLFSIDGEENSTYVVNPEMIVNSINSLSSAASKEEVQTIIKGCLTEISATLSENENETSESFNINARVNFIENILSNLAYVVTSAIVSPKLYLLFAVNLKIFGLQSNFSLSDFIDMHRKLVVDCIREIRDHIISFIVKELMGIIGELAERLSLGFAIEQAEYYRALMRNLIECFRRNRGLLDFNIDDVNYADIYQEDLVGSRNDNC